MQHVAANRNFTEIFLVGDDKKKSKFLFNLKRSEYCETLTNLGTMVETMKNSWMYNELMLSFVNSNGTRMLVNLSKKRMVKS